MPTFTAMLTDEPSENATHAYVFAKRSGSVVYVMRLEDDVYPNDFNRLIVTNRAVSELNENALLKGLEFLSENFHTFDSSADLRDGSLREYLELKGYDEKRLMSEFLKKK